MLGTHPDVGWVSNYAERWPRAVWLNAFSPLYRAANESSRLRRLLPQPSEGDSVWDMIEGASRPIDHGPRTAGTATEDEFRRAHALIGRGLKFQRRPRFLNKNTRNTRRVGYLDALFPDCVIVHVIRNPIAVVESLLRVEWWPTLRAWPFDGATPREWVRKGGREEEMAATIWRRETELARDAGSLLGRDRYVEVRYEDYVTNPLPAIREVVDFAALPWSATFERRLHTFDVRPAASRPTSLRPDQIAVLAPIVEPLATQLGYADDAAFS